MSINIDTQRKEHRISIQTASRQITEMMLEINRACNQDASECVFDEYTIFSLNRNNRYDFRILSYYGPRDITELSKRFQEDFSRVWELLCTRNDFEYGDFELASRAFNTKFDAVMFVGKDGIDYDIFIVFNNTRKSLVDICLEGKWSEAHQILKCLSAFFEASPIMTNGVPTEDSL